METTRGEKVAECIGWIFGLAMAVWFFWILGTMFSHPELLNVK